MMQQIAAIGRIAVVACLAGVTLSGGAWAVSTERAAIVAGGDLPTTLDPADFTVRVDGRSAEVVGARRLAAEADWRVVVYFDTPLLSPEGLSAAVEALSKQVDDLVGLGPVTLVVADPEPRQLLAPTTHGHEVLESLDFLAQRSTLAGELLWRRLRFVEERRAAVADEAAAFAAMERERALLARQQEALARCLAARAEGDARLLVLVQDGFDLDFKRFYLSRTPSLEELETEIDAAHAALGREIASAGWTVLGMSLGRQGSEFVRPLEPLRRLTEWTGGSFVREAGDLTLALRGMQTRARLTYRLDGPSSAPAPLEITFRDRPIGGPRWSGAVTTRPSGGALPTADGHAVVRLLAGGVGPYTGPTRVTAVTGGHAVGYVAFFLDGFLVDVAHRAPFRTRLMLGLEPEHREVRAEAFSSSGLKLGEDVLDLNSRDTPFRVEIVEVRGEPSAGRVEIEASVSVPQGRRLQSVEFYWNEELRHRLEETGAVDGLIAEVATTAPVSGDHYRVVATLDDGSSLESARLAADGPLAENVDVNLVELFALVSARGNGQQPALTRDDFELYHAGESQQIQGFARAENVPLTLGVAVDTSQSMADWQTDLRDGAASFFEATLGERDQALLTDFDTRPRLTQPPTNRRELLVGRMGGLEFEGYTALYDAILFSLTQFEEQGGRKALVVLTDGDDYASSFRPERCIAEARRLGVPIYMVVLENPRSPLDTIERMINQRLARQTGGQIFFFSTRSRLDEIYRAIEADLRSQYLITWAVDRPLSVADLGEIRVEVRDRRLSVRTILGSSLRAQ